MNRFKLGAGSTMMAVGLAGGAFLSHEYRQQIEADAVAAESAQEFLDNIDVIKNDLSSLVEPLDRERARLAEWAGPGCMLLIDGEKIDTHYELVQSEACSLDNQSVEDARDVNTTNNRERREYARYLEENDFGYPPRLETIERNAKELIEDSEDKSVFGEFFEDSAYSVIGLEIDGTEINEIKVNPSAYDPAFALIFGYFSVAGGAIMISGLKKQRVNGTDSVVQSNLMDIEA